MSTGAVSQTFAFQLIAIFNAASSFGRWLPGYLADRWGRYNLMLLTLGMCLISCAALWVPAAVLSDHTLPDVDSNGKAVLGLLVVFCVFCGFASGANISLTPVAVGMLCDTEDYGRYYATCYSIVSLGTLTGTPIAGAIIAANGGAYWGIATFASTNYFLAVACYMTVRIMKVGWRLKAVY